MPSRPAGGGIGFRVSRSGRLLLLLALLFVASPVLIGGISPMDGGAGATFAVALPVLTGVLAAQQQPGAGREGCDLVRSRRLNSVVQPSGERVTYITGPLAFQCDDGTRIRADSVVDFQATRFRQLMGDVEIDGPETRLVADRVHRSDDQGRIEAWGSVEVEQKGSDTRMVGDSLVFFESGPFRAESELDVLGERPYAVLRLGGEGEQGAGATDPTGPAGPSATPPDTVFGDRLRLEGESRFVATGDVRVRRSEMDAFGDSLDFARDENVARLFGAGEERARIEGREFDLEARRVDLFLRGDQLEEVRAVERARLTGEGVEMEAPRIRIFMTEGETERLVAVRERSDADADTVVVEGAGPERTVETDDGAPVARDRTTETRPRTPSAGDRSDEGRPTAVAEDFVLWADSIEVSAPGQRLDRVHAVGRARGESLARDSLNTPDMPEMIRRDWIEGDTIVAHFVALDSTGAGGEASGGERRAGFPDEETSEGDRPENALERLIATGNARSLYRLAPQDSVSVVSVEEEGDEGNEGDDSPEPGDDGGDPDGAGGGGAGAVGDTVTVSGTPPGPPGDSAAASPERARRGPAIHYVVGNRITIVLVEGEVERMEVQGQTRGLYLEPVAARSSGRTP